MYSKENHSMTKLVQMEKILPHTKKEGPNKIDKTIYAFSWFLGEIFYSIEKKEPKVGDERYIYDVKFST